MKKAQKHFAIKLPRLDAQTLKALLPYIAIALFTEKVKQLISFKEAQEQAEKEAREKERQERIKARRNKRGMER